MAKVSKRYPKTTGVVAEGVCEHTYTTRISLPSYSGKIRTKAKDKEVQGFKNNQAKFMSGTVCKTCEAYLIFSKVSPSVKGIVESLGVSPLPEITGSYSQRAWAERIRHEYLISLISWGVASIPNQSILEYFNSSEVKEYTSEELKKEISNFDKILLHLSDGGGYLRHILDKEINSGTPSIRLRRLLVMRFIFFLNSNVLLENRHTAWIMREKRGYSAPFSNFNNIPPREFLSLSHAINYSLQNVKEYERLVELFSERVYDRDKLVIDSLPESEDLLSKLDMLKVFRSLNPEKEMPF